MGTSSTVLAADLVPWWFAAGFWVAFLALVLVVARDVRRLGGPRRLVGAVRRALDDRLDPHDDEPGPRDRS